LLDVDKPAAAMEELRACESEVPRGDEEDRAWWAELIEEAGRVEPGAAPDPAT
jgi:hypothetical protein